MDFTNKIVLVTGASRGIGKAIAIQYALHGADVAITSSKSDGNEVVEQIESLGRKAIHIQSNVTEEDSVKNAILRIIEEFGRLDILVNNAGIVIPGHLEDAIVEDFEKTFAINVTGTFLMSKYAVAQMKQQSEGGVIVNIGSVAGLKGHIDRLAYCASKGAVIAMSKAMATELVKDNIRVNVVCPGTTRTPAIDEKINNASDPVALEEMFVKRQPMGRLGTPDEIAQAVLFASCDEAAYMTGSTLVIDGGMTM